MSHSPPPLHSPEAKRPKGILKNPSHRRTPPFAAAPSPTSPVRPSVQSALSEKDITLQNTLVNAGRRRSSTGNPNSRPPSSRRRSSPGKHGDDDMADDNTADDEEDSPRLKWDEANLYLTEQEKSSTMKITEPKTPYAKKYDPLEDEEEIRTLDAVSDLKVDELDGLPSPRYVSPTGGPRKQRTRDDDIPGLELGDPEEAVPERGPSPKQVVVSETEDNEHAGELSEDDAEKHRRFEEMRKRHYEMKDVKGLLGHPEELDEDDDSDEDMQDGSTNGIPPLPNGAPVPSTANRV